MANTVKLVLDLPQIYTKPSLDVLIEALNLLELGPPSWDASDAREPPVQDDPQAIASYLTKIVSSPLKWLDDDGREQIWDLASRRLSERSGRTGKKYLLYVVDVKGVFCWRLDKERDHERWHRCNTSRGCNVFKQVAASIAASTV